MLSVRIAGYSLCALGGIAAALNGRYSFVVLLLGYFAGGMLMLAGCP